jgi:hypothetical protein
LIWGVVWSTGIRKYHSLILDDAIRDSHLTERSI